MSDSRLDVLRDAGLSQEMLKGGAYVTPGLAVSAYAFVVGALPIIVGILTVALLTLQIVYTVRKLRERRARADADPFTRQPEDE